MPQQNTDAVDDELLFERVESFGGGMDAFSRATLLPADGYQYAENMLVTDSMVKRTRPGAVTLDAVISEGSKIQGLVYFDINGTQRLLAGCNGNLYGYTGSGNWSAALSFTVTSTTVNWEAVQGVNLVLITDGTQNMRTWDGTNFVDCGSVAGNQTSDPPVGATMLCWHTGRMFASGKASEPDTVYASYLLEFGTGKWDHLRFKFRVGGGDGDPVMAMVSMQDFVLVVLKETSVYLVSADPAVTAAEWQILKLTEGIGCVNKRAAAVAGNDCLFMARDGVRSVRRMQAAAGQYEVSPPLSRPLQPYIDRINWDHPEAIVARTYHELTFFSVPLDSDTNPTTTFVWSARLSRWVGVFTGWSPWCWEITRFDGTQRLVFGDNTGRVKAWKDYTDPDLDSTYLDDATAITCRHWTRAWQFGEPINNKDLYLAELRFGVSNALVTAELIADNDSVKTFEIDVRQGGVDLPVDLPFDLASPARPVRRRGLRGLPPCNEVYLKLESTAGWWELWNVTMCGFLNMLEEG